jgi:hypothetical protein
MICDLCTLEIIRGTMYRTDPVKSFRGGFKVCYACRRAVESATPLEVNEPLCACGKMPEWVCSVSLDPKPCGPLPAQGSPTLNGCAPK